ncbi:TRAPP trafficking subunit Trs65 [Teratosphaeria destructans]|uniref:TRAPP trafficking subunit Trs65 n=1 Tax=Teratosphaeria destructans TaxID=418781 RepID=A0A9W7W4H4_9PEZI|nr:TRAPP trafficking subunit Trs65 [Teratosphaeria destructans]
MADRDFKTRFETLLDGAVLDVAVLQATDVSLDELLAGGSLERLRNAPTRKNVFFDEHSKITIVLKATAAEDDLRRLLPNLEVVLAAHATDAVPQGTGNTASAPGTLHVVSQIIAGAAYDRLLSVDDLSFVVWQATLHLVWPRARLQRPTIYFTANLSSAVQPSTDVVSAEATELKPFEPLPANVLAPLNRVPEFEGKDIHLSADRITKVAPKAPKKVDAVKPIRGASKQAFPMMAAMFVRIKSTTLPDSSVASLHVEASRNISGNLVVDDLRLVVPDPDAKQKAVAAADQAAREGRVGPAVTDVELKTLQPMTQRDLPIRMSAGDETILLYQIEANTTKLYVSVKATLSLDQGTPVKLDMTSEASERSTPLPASTDTQYQWSRPAKHDATPRHVSSTSAQKPQTIDDKDTPPSTGSITIYFTAPATTLKGDKFVVKIKCVNSTKRPRHLTIVPVHQRSAQSTRPKQPSSDAKSEINPVAGIFDASLRPSSAPAQVQPKVVCLTPDVRIGPLVPGASYDTQVIFRTTSDGVLELSPLRVIDLETKQTVDVWDLPDVVALESDAETSRQPARTTKILGDVKPSEDQRFVAWRQFEEESFTKKLTLEK